MTDPNMSRPKPGTLSEKAKPSVAFRTWLEETLYCRMPSRPNGQHEKDLVIRVSGSKVAKDRSISDVQVRQSIQILLDDGLLERYGRQGEHYLRKAKGDRSIVLRFI